MVSYVCVPANATRPIAILYLFAKSAVAIGTSQVSKYFISFAAVQFAFICSLLLFTIWASKVPTGYKSGPTAGQMSSANKLRSFQMEFTFFSNGTQLV